MPSASSAVPSAAAPGDESLAAGAAPKVLLGRYELGGLLGRGASAKVYYARDLLTGRDVAIKSFPNPRAGGREGEGSTGTATIEREAAILARLRHRHVVRLHEILGTRKKVHFVLDLAGGGELFSLVDSSGRMTEDLARHYFRQLVSAVRYCHSRGVYHRDIKPENLLLDGDGDLKVADFGLGAVADGSLHNTLCGTPAYVAPEILSKQGYYCMPRYCNCGGDCYLVGGPALYNMVGVKNSLPTRDKYRHRHNSQGVRTSASTGGMNLASRVRTAGRDGEVQRTWTENLHRTILGNGRGSGAIELWSRRVNYSRRARSTGGCWVASGSVMSCRVRAGFGV